jgi:hypothetical protein
MGGASGGYVHPLGDRWSVELTLGAGYLLNDYQRYTVEPTHSGNELVRQGTPMRLKGLIFPLKAGVSLQWAITSKDIRRWKWKWS